MLTHFGSPTGAAGAASCVAADPTHEARLQQLLSPGVQTVQLLHDAWDQNSHFNVSTPFPGKAAAVLTETKCTIDAQRPTQPHRNKWVMINVDTKTN